MGIMGNKLESTIVCWRYMGDYMWKFLRTRGLEGPEASGDGLGFRVLWF